MASLEASSYKKILYNITMQVLYGNETETIDSKYIQSLKIEKDPINLFLPIYGLTFLATNTSFKKMIVNKNNLKIRIKVVSYEQGKNESSVNKNYYTNELDMVFKAIFENNNITVDDLSSSSGINSGQVEEYTNLVDLYLYNQEDLNSCSILNNVCIKGNCNVSDAIGYIVNNCNIKNLLINNIDNYQKFNQIFIPQLNLNRSLYYLQHEYNIYKNGLIAFLDLGLLYIMRRDFKEKVPLKLGDYEKIFINITKSNNSDAFIRGYYNNKSNKTFYINALYMDGDFTNSNASSSLIDGDSFKIINKNKVLQSPSYDSEKNKFSFNTVYDSIKSGTNTKYIDDLHNVQGSEIANDIESSQDQINFTLYNCSFVVNLINKRYNLVFTNSAEMNQLYKSREYKPVHIKSVLSKNNNNLFEMITNVTLQKI